MKSKSVAFRTGLTAVILILLAAGCAHGWGNTWAGAGLEQIVNGMRWKLGALKFSATLSLINAGYDSDIYFGISEKRVPDYTMNMGTPFRLFLPIKKKMVFEIYEYPQYVFFVKTKMERALNNDFKGNVHFVLDRVYFQVGGGLANVKERLSPELTINVRQKQNNLNALALWQFSKRGSLALQYNSSTYLFENPAGGSYDISGSLDRQEDFLNLRAYLEGLPNTRFYLDAEYGANSLIKAVSRFKDSRSYALYGGVEFPVAQHGVASGIRGRINLGHKYFDILDPQITDYSGFVGHTSVSIGIFRLTSLQFFLSRDVQYSALSSFFYYVMTSSGGGLSRWLTRRSRFEYGFTSNRGFYPTGPAGAGELPKIRYALHSLKVVIQLQRELDFSLSAIIGNRIKSVTFPGGKHYYIGFNLVYGSRGGESLMLRNPISR